METADAARRWAATWKDGWERLDVDTIVALYAPDAVLSTEPFRVPCQGRDAVRRYVAQAFADEEEPQVVMGPPLVDGRRAAVPWWTALREEGVDATLAGTSLLEFDPDGLVVRQWDTWNLAEGRREPAGRGPFD